MVFNVKYDRYHVHGTSWSIIYTRFSFFVPEPYSIKRTKYEDKKDTVSVTEEIDKQNTTIGASNK